MATTKSGKKSVRQAATRRVFNMRRTRTMKDAAKQVEISVRAKDKAGAEGMLAKAYKAIDKATKQGIIKKNTAARKKSKLAKAIANI